VLNKKLKDIVETALFVYMLRNSGYVYIQCMGTQMRFFMEEVMDEDFTAKFTHM